MLTHKRKLIPPRIIEIVMFHFAREILVRVRESAREMGEHKD
jgi:hypothetical protein